MKLKSLFLIILPLITLGVNGGLPDVVDLIENDSGFSIVKNPFTKTEDLVIWRTEKDTTFYIPEKYRVEFNSIKDKLNNGSAHKGLITYIDKGQKLIGDDVNSIKDVIELIPWVRSKEDFLEKSNIDTTLLHHFLILHEFSHSLSEGSEIGGLSDHEIFADINTVEYLINDSKYSKNEILKLVEYLIVMRTYRFVCCFDLFHYSGNEMLEIRDDIIKS
jgi:hypothetical protein